MVMKHIVSLSFVAFLVATPALAEDKAEDGLSLMEQGAKLLLQGIIQEMEPAIDDLRNFGEEVEPAEERVGQLIRMLRRERLLAYPGWDPAPTGSMPREREGNEC